jgi:4-hydroxy-tetrahydrodipicolinate reductase
VRIALVGYGRMGKAVEAEALAADHEVVARLGRPELGASEAELVGALAGADVAIDFSVGAQVARTVSAARTAGADLVIGTTGLDAAAAEAIEGAHDIGLVHGPNFSVGVHVFFRLAREAARLVDAAGGYDVYVQEAHHRHKRDHPSGTARRLADILVAGLGEKTEWKEGPPQGIPDPATLYVDTIRAGEVPGTHVVGIEGPDDRLEVRHEARGREGFARGAIRAAEWIHGREGVFTFADVMDDLLGAGQDEGKG